MGPINCAPNPIRALAKETQQIALFERERSLRVIVILISQRISLSSNVLMKITVEFTKKKGAKSKISCNKNKKNYLFYITARSPPQLLEI